MTETDVQEARKKAIQFSNGCKKHATWNQEHTWWSYPTYIYPETLEWIQILIDATPRPELDLATGNIKDNPIKCITGKRRPQGQ